MERRRFVVLKLEVGLGYLESEIRRCYNIDPGLGNEKENLAYTGAVTMML
jgi:hypothetical protein